MRNCPSREDLLAFHLGNLPESSVDALGDHLEQCSDCSARLAQFEESGDPFFEALRHPAPDDHLEKTRSRAAGADRDTAFVVEVPNLSGYDILDSLGSGGMGVVYKARQQRLNRLVALKQLPCRRERDLARARREAESLAQLQHPNIVQIFEIIEHEGRVYLALELVEGGPLSARLGGKPQPLEASAQLVETLARAMHYAHVRGIVHRDLKPSNVLLARSDDPSALSRAVWSGYIPKITDFGVAKQLSYVGGETRHGDVIGTPGYMAPEQAGEAGHASPAADVYSLGVLLYELLTGRVPLLDTNVVDTLLRVRNEEPVPPRHLVPRLPRDLETICLKCLQKEPGQRYASASALADDLHRFLEHEPIQARPTPLRERVRKWVRRYPAIATLSAGILGTVVLGFALVAWQWQRAEDKADLAQQREEREKEARLQVQRLVAHNALNEGVNLCENGQTERGLLWMVRALEMAEANGDHDLQRAARCNLAAWKSNLIRLQAELPHGSWAWTVAFSPDGRTLATGSYDKTAQLWDADGKPRGEPLQHRYPVWSVAFSPDGKTLLTGSGDPRNQGGEVRLWEVASGRMLASWPQADRVKKALFNPETPTCLILADQQAVLRSLPDGKLIGTPLTHSPPSSTTAKVAMTAALSPNGKLIATAGQDGMIRFWDAATGKPQGQPVDAAEPLGAIAFSPDGRTLLSGDLKGKARMWDVASRRPCSSVLVLHGPISALAFSPDSQVVATASRVYQEHPSTGRTSFLSGGVQLWRVPTGEALGPPLQQNSAVRSLAFSPQGRRLLVGCVDASAHLYLVATGEKIAKLLSGSGNITQVAFSPSGTHCLTANAGGGKPVHARLWQIAPEDHLPRLLLHEETVRSVTFSPDGRSLLSGSNDHRAQLWDVATGQPQGSPLMHNYAVAHAAFSSDGQTLCTLACEYMDAVGWQWEAALWDPRTGRKRLRLNCPHLVYQAAFCNDDHALLVGDIEGNLQLYDVSTGKPIEPHLKQSGPVYSLAFDFQERTLLTGAVGGAILWDWKARRQLKKLSMAPNEVHAYFYPDRSGLLLEQHGFAQAWEYDGSARKAPPLFHAEGGIAHLAFSSDSRSVLIRDAESRARLWDVSTGKRIGPAPGHSDIAHVAFSPDGRHLAAAGKYGKVALWETPQPLQGTSERLRLWVETLAGMELDAQQLIRPLDSDELRRRRTRLDELGGPPTED